MAYLGSKIEIWFIKNFHNFWLYALFNVAKQLKN